MKTIIQDSLKNSYSYSEYREMMQSYALEGKSTGELTPDHIHYTHLNEARMHRLDKTQQLTEDVQHELKQWSKPQLWVVLSETWCGDAAQVLPVIAKMAEMTPAITLRILLRDEHPEVMDLFLTNGTRSIPKLIMVDEESGEVLADFGPRPNEAKQLILDYKATHGVVDDTAKTALQKWYLNDKGISIQNEILALMKTAVVL